MPSTHLLWIALLAVIGLAMVTWLSLHLAEIIDCLADADDALQTTADDMRLASDELRAR